MANNHLTSWITRFISNDPSLFGAAVNDEPLAGRLRAKQIGSIITYTPIMLLATTIAASLFGLAHLGTPTETKAVVWSLGMAAFVLYTYLRWRVVNNRTQRNYASIRGPRRAILNALFMGLAWSTLPLLFIAGEPTPTQLMAVAITVGTIYGGAFTLSTIPSAVVAYALPISIATLSVLHMHNVPLREHMSILLLMFTLVIFRSTYSQASLFAERVIGEYEQEKQRDMIGILLGEFEENANDWLWETDSLGRIAYVSGKFAELTNLSTHTLKGKSLLRVMARGFEEEPPQPASAWRRMTDHLHQRTPFRGIELQIVANNARRWINMTGKPIYNSTGVFSGFRGFCSDVTARREDEAKIAYLARFDAVTGLPNRVSFGDTLDDRLTKQKRNHAPLALHCIDLDGFKEINDTFGHAIGDAFLVEVGARIRGCIGKKDFVARLGGDEFAVIQDAASTEYEASEFAKEIIKAISQPFSISGNTMRAGGSIGIAFAPKDGLDRQKLMVNGDLALYRAKSDGRGVCRFYESSMDDEARERRAIESELREAVQRNELKLLFQPILDLQSGHINNCEALLRWDNPKLGDIPPSTFIPIAEESGLIIPIGEWVIGEACRQAAKWPANTKVAVNLSAVQFQSPGLLPVVMNALDESGIEANRLEIEITESVLLSNIERVLSIIDTLDRLGVRIALDDFGTGYSSLAYIRQIEFDKIKIDASFVRDMLHDKNCGAIIRAVTGLARELGIRITAEGVETSEQMEVLKNEGCSEVQGYLISEPLDADHFAEFVRKTHANITPAEVGAEARIVA